MKRLAATLAALAGGIASSSAGPLPGIDRAVVEGAALPAKLSAFGLFQGNDPKQPRGAIPYELQTPLFSDYADKARLIILPPGQKAGVAGDGSIAFPVGTVLVKSFGWADVNGGRPVETRLLIHRASGWVALPYVWDADGKDATLKIAGARIPVSFAVPGGGRQRISYAVPNKNQCKECHSRGDTLVPLGPKAANMVIDRRAAAQYFSGAQALRPVMPRWDDPKTGTVERRARAYLDANCGHCHHPAGSASNSGLFLGWEQTGQKALGIGKRPVAAGRGSGGLDFAIAPGQPGASILIYRLESLEPGIAMPEVGRSAVHREGAALLREWIAAMPKGGQ